MSLMSELKNISRIERDLIDRHLRGRVEVMDPAAKEVAEYCLSAGGKRLRGLLVLLTGRAVLAKDVDLYPLAGALEMLHAATLLHDDVIDRAGLRRGQAAAHQIFGSARAILAGDVMLAEASLAVAAYEQPRMVTCLAQAISRTASGEIRGLAMQGRPQVDFDEYLGLVTDKTAFLFQAACLSAAMLGQADPDLEQAASDYGLNLGIAYQMIDDVLDYSDNGQTGKIPGNDLSEGLATLPFIFLLKTLSPARAETVAEDFVLAAEDAAKRQELIDLVRYYGCDELTRQTAETYLQKAGQALSAFPTSKEKIILAQLIEFVRDRDY